MPTNSQTKPEKTGGKMRNTALDALPYGSGDPAELEGRVRRPALPEGVTGSRLARDIVHIALPCLVELILTQLTSMADQIMVGRLPGEEGIMALAAVGLAAHCPSSTTPSPTR